MTMLTSIVHQGMLWAVSMEELQDKAETFGISGPKLVAQVAIFIILFLLLQKFAFGPILKILEERKQRIEESMANAEKIKEELAQAEKTREELIKQANAEATRLIEEAKSSADSIGSKKIQEATVQAESVLAKAREAAEQDRAQMMNEIRDEMGRLVVETTAKVIGKALTPEDQRRLQDEAVSHLN